MLNQILTTFQSFFSRSFWLGSFLPVAICGAFHLLVAKTVFPDLPSLDALTGASAYTAKVAVILVALVIAAYALSPLSPIIRGLLDGSLLPSWMHDALRREHVIM